MAFSCAYGLCYNFFVDFTNFEINTFIHGSPMECKVWDGYCFPKKLDEDSANFGKMRFRGDINATFLSYLVEKSSGVTTLEFQKSPSIGQNIWMNICAWTDVMEITIKNSFVGTLPGRFIFNCRNLSSLYLADNMITYIAHDAFDNLTKLVWLDLSYNQLKIIHKDTFKPLINLICLNLQENQLQSIDEDLFSHNPDINAVYLNKSLKTTYFKNNSRVIGL